ncbi:MAG TPA: DUF885 domain-containing protein [Actinocrinis sp.]|jgi:uncharacterized protein (DUF885 family)|uniref:DUF885 domain-containing protein n=1 Tax=Actinocrinis sp. TaxID=1920516 RepID=UPI002DDD0B66|nr:DUF885 domain-containing protein [Actinocrinis sp.]HEV3168889.1 DUF885 domain-containing protein [Actinocrinis sp.]
MSHITEIADRYVERAAALDPVGATFCGIDGYEDKMIDLSPVGFVARTELERDTLAKLAAAEPRDERERIAREAMQERLGLAVEEYEAGDTTSRLNVLASWMQGVRQAFDLMPLEGEQAQRNIAARMDAVSTAYSGLRRTYLEAAKHGRTAARRQVLACAAQAADWSSGETDFYAGLVERTGAEGALRTDLERAAAKARAATAEFGRFLERELLPTAREDDAAGRDWYARASRSFLGAAIDLDEAYEWGWSEVKRLEAEMTRVAGLVVPGGGVDDAVAALDADPQRKITGAANYRAWMQDLGDRTIAELHGRHFDIPEPARRIEAMIAPTSDGGVYYTQPSEDFSRPGRMWWAVPGGLEEFSTWREVTTVYHEGVPGHHLQCSQAVYQREKLNRWQRLMCWVSGHGEGWALYAERLMEELGYLEDPGELLGMLDAQMLRAARVVVDLGVHLKLPVPKGVWNGHEGEVWNADLAWEFLRSHTRTEEGMLRFELDRYLGWPGQAPSYKLGERIWLQSREEAKARKGAAFDLKEFHAQALSLGSMGLDPLRAALARL